MHLLGNEQVQWSGKRRVEQDKLIRTGCLNDQPSYHEQASNKSPNYYTTSQRTARSKTSGYSRKMTRFSDWVLEDVNEANTARVYEMGVSTEFWPRILHECYDEWLMMVQKTEEARDMLAAKLSGRGSTLDDLNRFNKIRSFYGYIMKDGGMFVQMGNGMRISWRFARMGPFADPKEFRALVRNFHLDQDPDLTPAVVAYNDALESTVRDKDDVAQQLLLEVIQLEKMHEELEVEVPMLRIRELLISVTISSRRNKHHTHDFFAPQDRAWTLEELSEESVRVQESLEVKTAKDCRLYFSAQTRQHILQFMKDEWHVDIDGMRELLEKE